MLRFWLFIDIYWDHLSRLIVVFTVCETDREDSFFFSVTLYSRFLPSGATYSRDHSLLCTCDSVWAGKLTLWSVNKLSPAPYAQWAADRCPFWDSRWLGSGRSFGLILVGNTFIRTQTLLSVFSGLPTVPLLPSTFSAVAPLNPAATTFSPSTTLAGGSILLYCSSWF